MIATSARSPSGYARLVAIAAEEPPVASTIAPNATAAPAALIARAPIAASSNETVSPLAGDALAEEQHDPGDSGKVEQDPASIGRRREGHRVGVPERDRVVEGAEGPEGLPGRDQQPAERRPVGDQSANRDHEGGQGGSERRHPAKEEAVEGLDRDAHGRLRDEEARQDDQREQRETGDLVADAYDHARVFGVAGWFLRTSRRRLAGLVL